jgi:hypothetical protein
MQAHRDPKRESEPTALPDIEVWHHQTFEGDDPMECPRQTGEYLSDHPDNHGPDCDGWYYWFCFPGCMPDSEPSGPFETAEEALADAREGMED